MKATTPSTNTAMDTHTLMRTPRNSCAKSMRRASIQVRPAVYHMMYMANKDPAFEFFHDFGTKENDERSTDEIPNHLIQEGRVEQRACRAGRSVIALFAVTDGASLHIQLQTPRQGRRAP